MWFWCCVGIAVTVMSLASNTMPTLVPPQGGGCIIGDEYEYQQYILATRLRTALKFLSPVAGAVTIWLFVRLVNKTARARQIRPPPDPP